MAQRLLVRSARCLRLVAYSRSVVAPRAAAFGVRRPAPSVATPLRSLSGQSISSPSLPLGAPHRCVATSAVSGDAMKNVALEPETLPAVSLSAAAPGEWEGDLLLLAVTEEDFATEADVTSIKSDALKAVDGAFGGLVSEVVAAGGFDGKQGSQSKVVRVGGGSKAKHVGLVGLGKAAKMTVAAEWGASPFQSLGSAIAALAKANKVATVALAPVSPLDPSLAATALAQITQGTLSGAYESTRFKTKKSPTASKLQALHVLTPLDEAAASAAIARGVAFARGNLLTRYLVEAPPNICTPTHMAETAAHIAAKAPENFTLRVYEKAECEAMNMGLFLGVAEASDEPLKFIHLVYSPKGGNASRKVAVVGKGLTFDSGGYNLKAGAGSMIEMMKFDMGGAGATLGAARILADTKPADVEVHFIIASCENMVAGRGLRPGDILTSASGKTVEVNNTDAEGRLTLADAMWFAQEKCGVTHMVDVATLTGACMVALGGSIAGLFTPSDAMAGAVAGAAKTAGEKLWRMPWEAEYFEEMKSPIADMKNTGGRLGGAITAALFLKQYVNEGVEWAHVDLAGPVWSDKAGGATGFGAALLAEWASTKP